MKVMRLNVTYNGWYGGNVDKTILLPLDINGVLFEELEENTYDCVVWLGEIEGEHSECYGDLHVDFVDLDKLTPKAVSALINKSDFSEFEAFFEEMEIRFEKDEDEYDFDKVKEVLGQYGIEHEEYMIKTSFVHAEFIEQLKEQYVENFKTITVLEKDYEAAVDLLEQYEIEVFE